jgi:anion-transporting  ArsA/GET3 family ATPase
MASPASTIAVSDLLSGGKLVVPRAREVVLVVGPGGVGKTTVAAALALRAADSGRRTIVVTIDPSRRLAQALGIAREGRQVPGEIVPIQLGLGAEGGRLDGLLLDTASTFDAIVRQHSVDAAAADAMLNNPIYRATVRHLAGALEFAATAQVYMLHAAKRWDLVVLDTPPTANAIQFLDTPAHLTEIVGNPAAKFLASSSRIGMRFLGLGSGVLLKVLGAIGGGEFVKDLGGFLRDFSSALTEFERRAGKVADLITSPSTGVVLTTAATDFSVREATSFVGVLLERGLLLDGIVLNRFDAAVPPWPDDDSMREVLALRGGDEESVARAREIHGALGRQAEQAAAGLAELRSRWPHTPVVAVPRIDPPPTTIAELRRMGAMIWPDGPA